MTLSCSNANASGLDVDLSIAASLQPSLLGIRDTHISIDPSRPGKQYGHLVLPHAAEHGLAHLRVPLCSIRGRTRGPTVTLVAGVHGDEYEGPLTLHRLARELKADAMNGCLIIMPALNGFGLLSNQRCLPHTGEDLDLCFPGHPAGSLGQRLACEVVKHLVQPADLVVDLRSGGGRLDFAPSAAVRFMGVPYAAPVGVQRGMPFMGVSNGGTLEEAMAVGEAAMVAFGAPNCVRLPASAGADCLQSAVASLGKAYVQSELGGGGGCRRAELAIADVGVRNVLRHMGVLDEPLQLRASRMLEVRDQSCFVHAQASGLLEPFVQTGGDVWCGDTLACLVDPDDIAGEPHHIAVPRNAVLLALHHGGPVQAGDLIAILADEVKR